MPSFVPPDPITAPMAPSSTNMTASTTSVAPTSDLNDLEQPKSRQDVHPVEVPVFQDSRAQPHVTCELLPDPVPPKELVSVLDPQEWRQQLQTKLYGRQTEEQTLLDKFHELKQGSTPEFILISGPSGSGKTSLAKSLKPIVEQTGGYFLTGKFDQLRRPVPYSAFVSAFTELVNIVVRRGPAAVQAMQARIRDRLGDEAVVVTRMIPSLERILGPSRDLRSSAKASDAIQRFVFCFRSFLRAVCQPSSPMVLMLDDLHWADDCSLDILSSIVTDDKNHGLVLIGTSDTVSSKTYLSQKLRDLEDKEHARIVHVSVGSLELAGVRGMVEQVFGLDGETSASLATIVLAQTQGNLVYIVEFLRWLQDSELLFVDGDRWRFDAEEVALTIDTRKVGDYVVDKLEQLPADVREVLKVAACLGSHVEEQLIEYVVGHSVDESVKQAAAVGVLVADHSRGGFSFEHDRVQDAVYRLVPENERELFHLEIGRRLWRKLDEDQLKRYLFTLLSQMRIGQRLITREKERTAVATLCLHGGTKAARSSTFRMSLVYLEFGIAMLGLRSWRDDYDLTLALHSSAAEMAMATSHLERMEELIDIVLANAKSLPDKMQVYSTRIYAFGMTERNLDAIQTVADVLRGLKECFPSKPGVPHLLRELRSVKRLLKGKSDEQLLRLPLMENKEKLACLQIMNACLLTSMLSRPEVTAFMVLKMMRITLTDGLSVFSSIAFTGFGIFCIGSSRNLQAQNVDDAIRFGRLGLALLDRFEAKEFLPRVYALYYGCIHCWKYPLREGLDPLLKGYKIGMQTGDSEGACACANFLCMSSIDAGVPLKKVLDDYANIDKVMTSGRQRMFMLMSSVIMQNLHHYVGLSKDPSAAQGNVANYDLVAKAALENGQTTIAISVCFVRMMSACVFNDFDLAEKQMSAIAGLWLLPPGAGKLNVLFFVALVALECARLKRNLRKNLRLAKKMMREIRLWATKSPHNGLDKLGLLEAELFSVQGKNVEAYSRYVGALAMAKDSRFPFNAARICECAARHLYRTGDMTMAKRYFEESCLHYQEWEATAKVERLQYELSKLFPRPIK